MATSTERFGFTKPAGSDPASVVPLNSNIDLIELYLGRTQDSIAPLYDDTETYSVGDLRTYESRLYKCNTDILTPETFDPEKWDVTTAVQEGGGTGAGAIEKTQAEYNALTPEQKKNGALYMVQAGEQPQDTSGTFVTGSAKYEKVEVNCGFRPDYIEVTLPFSSGDTTAIYDASVSTTTSTWKIPQESNKYTIELGSVTGETGITDITDTGFKFRCNASNTRGVTCTFTASKEGQDAVNKIYYMGTEYANTNGGSGGGSEGEGVEIYSENEYIVGKWIDGKKLYQKTIDFGAMPAQGDSKSVAHNISDIDKIISWEAFGVNQSGEVMSVPNVSRGNVTAQTSMSVNSTNVYIFNGSSSDITSAYNGYVTIRYTKTVETPAPAWGGSVTNNYASFIDTDNVIQAETQVSSGTTGTYIATEDCYIRAKLWRSSEGGASLSIDEVEVLTNYSNSGTSALYNTIPLKKGQTATIDAGAGSDCSYTVYGITYASGGSSSGNSGIDYSTDEQDTGIKWIDGSPIYQKTIYIGHLTYGSNWVSVAHNIDDIDMVIDIKGSFLGTGDGRMYPITVTRPTQTSGVCVGVDSTYIWYMNSWIQTNATDKATVTLQYTKVVS